MYYTTYIQCVYQYKSICSFDQLKIILKYLIFFVCLFHFIKGLTQQLEERKLYGKQYRKEAMNQSTKLIKNEAKGLRATTLLSQSWESYCNIGTYPISPFKSKGGVIDNLVIAFTHDLYTIIFILQYSRPKYYCYHQKAK